ncbi:MAG: hypothetical protein MZW92_75760 [Comamonadaceae bacterium]|nr:hypothetical protein [Comamonadaceae bacterium]
MIADAHDPSKKHRPDDDHGRPVPRASIRSTSRSPGASTRTRRPSPTPSPGPGSS